MRLFKAMRKNPIKINKSFACNFCGKQIPPHKHGSCRNHCPFCLHSKHVDGNIPGDRSSSCHGLMDPINVEHNEKKGEVIVFRCTKCGKEHRNKIAPDDSRGALEELVKENLMR